LREAAKDAALRLAAQTEQDEIVTGEERVDDLRNDGVFVAVDAGKQSVAFFDGAQQVAAKFVLYGNRSGARVVIRNAAQLTDGARLVVRGPAGDGCACGHWAPFCAEHLPRIKTS